MTREELKDLADYIARTTAEEILRGLEVSAPRRSFADEKVVDVSGMPKGLNAISEMFGVSRATASHWAKTWMSPACLRIGKHIWVDVPEAQRLHKLHGAARC